MELTELLVMIMLLLTSRLTLTLTSPAPVCDPRLFNKLLRDSAALHSRLSQCPDLDPLPLPVLLPTVDFSLREWRAKTEQTRGQEVLGAVALLLEGVMAARRQLSPSCLSSLLGQLSAQTQVVLGALQGLLGTPSLPKGQTAAHREPMAIFLSFQQLLRGKVRFLLHALRPILCARQDQLATAAPGNGSMPSVRTTSGLEDMTAASLEKAPKSSARATEAPKRAFSPLNHTASSLDQVPAHLNITLGPLNRTHGISPVPSINTLGNSDKPPGTPDVTFQSPMPFPAMLTSPSIPSTGYHALSSSPSTLLTPTPRTHIPSTSPSATSAGNSASAICCLHSQDKTKDLQDTQGTSTSSPT